MNIFGQGWNTLSNRDNQSNRASAEALRALNVNGSTSAGKAEGGSTLSSLRPGNVFQGQILNITAQDVTILLDNLQTVHARLGESVELNIGQKLSFQVKENQGEQLVIRPMENSNVSGGNPAAEKALTSNGFALSDRNIKIANALMEAGMPLDKDTMRNVMQQSVRFPEADIKQLVNMNRLQLPVNEGNIRQFAQYTAHEHQLTQSMNQVMNSLEQAVSTVAQNGDLQQIQNFNQELIQIFGWKTDGNAGMQSTTAQVQEMVPQSMVNPNGEAGNIAETTTLNTSIAENAGLEVAQTANELQTTTGLSEISVPVAFQDDTAFFTSLRSQLTELGMPEEVFQKLTENAKDYGEVFSNLHEYMESDGQLPAEAVQNFFQSENFGKLLKKGIQEKWLMKPEDMKHPKEIDQLYEKIYEQAGKLEEYLGQSGQSGQDFSQHSQNMRENMQFMQQLNQQFIFAQLPMKMNGQDANSELFVYANKKKVQQGADGVKVLLHLDMPNLGGTDILVRLKDKKLHARFTMEDATSVTVVAENMEQLSQKLEEKGFYFTNEVSKVEPKPEVQEPIQPDAVIEEMFDQDLVTGQKRFTFDMRT